MRVLVTGGAGYIGSVMVAMLSGAGHDVMVLDDLSKGHREALRGAPLAQVDLEDLPAVVAACERFRPEACMHFAARSLVGESMGQPMLYFRANLGGGLNLLRGLAASGCARLVFSSTAAVYGQPGTVPITEDAPASPINPYGLTKLMFEQVLRELARNGDLRFVTLRYFNAAGADLQRGLGEDHEPETHLIPRLAAAALAGEPAMIYGTDYPTTDGTCVRDYIHISDLCRAHLLALERLAEGTGGETYNLGNGNGFSVREVVDAVRRASDRPIEVVESERRAGDPPVLVASSAKARAGLGWEPAGGGLDEIVKSAWLWHREHPGGYARG